MKQPTLFLSSTIYDFKDLRSAIKYHLEKYGCRVLASECNDFKKPFDLHSYHACLQSIKDADWFVLLIGSRVGGWYDEKERISITQQEYREAYRLHKEGRLNILAFVRSEVWQMREERKQLSKHLEKIDIDTIHKSVIAQYPSKSADDAGFIISFIDEVGRNKETIQATKTGTELPSGNWIHVFSSFSDIIDVIQMLPFANRPVDEIVQFRLLRQELVEILRVLLVKSSNGAVFSPKYAITSFHNLHTISPSDRDSNVLYVDTKSFDLISTLSFALLGKQLHPRVVYRILESPLFIQYDSKSYTFLELPVYTGLARLVSELQFFERSNISDSFKVVFENTPKNRPIRRPKMDVKTIDLLMLLHLLDRWSNIIDLCKSIISYIDGKEYTLPDLRPRSPIRDVEDSIDKENATASDVDCFLSK